MALIRATCSDCGDVDLKSRDLTVNNFIDSSYKPIMSEYCFSCPLCKMIETKIADKITIDILAAAGVNVKEIFISPDMLEHDAILPIETSQTEQSAVVETKSPIRQIPLGQITDDELIDDFRPRKGRLNKFEENLYNFLDDQFEYKKLVDRLRLAIQRRYEAQATLESYIANKPETERVVSEIQAIALTQLDRDRIVTELRRLPNVPDGLKIENLASRNGIPEDLDDSPFNDSSTQSPTEGAIDTKNQDGSGIDQVRSLLENSSLPPETIGRAMAIAELHPKIP